MFEYILNHCKVIGFKAISAFEDLMKIWQPDERCVCIWRLTTLNHYSHRDQEKVSGRRKEKTRKMMYVEVLDGKKVKQMGSVHNPGGQQVARGSLKQLLIDSSRSGDQFQRPINKCDWFIKTWVVEDRHPWGSQRSPRGARAERLFLTGISLLCLRSVGISVWNSSLPQGPHNGLLSFRPAHESMRMKRELVRAKL